MSGMALLKTKDIRAMRPEDLMLKFKELSDELMHERGIAAMGGAPASPGKLRALRTNVARIHTVMREVEITAMKKKAEEKTPAKKEKAKEKKAEKAAPKQKPKRERAEKRAAAKKPAAKVEEETK
jgi:large subunit ribosomal protein L29